MWVYYLGQKYANIGGKITPNFLQCNIIVMYDNTHTHIHIHVHTVHAYYIVSTGVYAYVTCTHAFMHHNIAK